MSPKRIRRREKRVPSTSQRGFAFDVDPSEPVKRQPGARGAPSFKKGKRDQLFIGDTRLAEYLEQVQLGWVLRLVSFLDEVDVTSLEKQYDGTGRHPYAPRMLLGLILYGILEGKWSLRELEALAARDVGAWWICEGLRPDHSTIGRFIARHRDVLTEAFFVELTETIVRKLRLRTDETVVDGTVIEAAASHYKALRREALERAAEKAREEAERTPEDEPAAERAAQLERAVEVAHEREGARRKKGRNPDVVAVVPHEPEAVLQRMKGNTGARPSYKPTLMTTTDDCLITGFHVHPTSETAAVEPLFRQHHEIMGAHPACTLLDAGFFSAAVLSFCVENDVDVLCSSGQARGADNFERRRRSSRHFLKDDFRFDAERNVYVCPEGQQLIAIGSWRKRAQPVTRYQGTTCSACPSREKCTRASARTVLRYHADDLKDAQREVMRQRAAKQRYRRRSLGERPFAGIKTRQGLTRFRRGGLLGARLETALHVAAWNVRVALGGLLIVDLTLWSLLRSTWRPTVRIAYVSVLGRGEN